MKVIYTLYRALPYDKYESFAALLSYFNSKRTHRILGGLGINLELSNIEITNSFASEVGKIMFVLLEKYYTEIFEYENLERFMKLYYNLLKIDKFICDFQSEVI